MYAILYSVGATVFLVILGLAIKIAFALGVMIGTEKGKNQANDRRLGELETKVDGTTKLVTILETKVELEHEDHVRLSEQLNAVRATVIALIAPRLSGGKKGQPNSESTDPRVIAIRERAAADATVVRAKGAMGGVTLVAGSLVTLVLGAFDIHAPWPSHIAS